MGLGVVLYFVTPYRDEPGHKSSLPLMRKLPVVSGVILLLIVLKGVMQGFITMFAMMGLVTVYEGRHILWTICRQMPVLLLLIMPIMAVWKLVQSSLGLGVSLALGWSVFLLLLSPVVSLRSRLDRRQAEAAGG